MFSGKVAAAVPEASTVFTVPRSMPIASLTVRADAWPGPVDGPGRWTVRPAAEPPIGLLSSPERSRAGRAWPDRGDAADPRWRGSAGRDLAPRRTASGR